MTLAVSASVSCSRRAMRCSLERSGQSWDLWLSGDCLIDWPNDRRALGVICPNDIHLCIAYSTERGEVGVRWVYEEWWDGLAWIASLRRWIAPYAASSTTPQLHQALRITVPGKRGVVSIRGCCWVSKKVTSNNGRAEGGGGNTIYITT
jgi:hypothetical protein